LDISITILQDFLILKSKDKSFKILIIITMEEQSISSKLAEMYELHKAGALTKEEYEQIKRQVLTQVAPGNIVDPEKQEERNILPKNKVKQTKKATRILIIAFLSSVLIFGVFLVLKNVAFSGKSESTVRIKNMKLNANLLPPPGLYVFNNGRGYKAYIRVIVKDGIMTLQKGENVSSLTDVEIMGVEDDGEIYSDIGNETKYVGNGIIEVHNHGATTEGGPPEQYLKEE
jgi:hypothetical protein